MDNLIDLKDLFELNHENFMDLFGYYGERHSFADALRFF